MPDASHQSNGQVTVPADLLAAVITSVSTVDSLRKEVLEARKEKSVLATEVSKLQSANAGLLLEIQRLKGGLGEFYLFPKLPREIQDMIWESALTAPQTLTFRDESVSRNSLTLSQVNIIMQTCRDARSKGTKLQFPYFKVFEPCRDWSLNKNLLLFINVYFDPEVTTIWVPDASTFIPGNFDFICSKCGGYMLSRNPCTHNKRLKCLAFSDKIWEDAGVIDVHGMNCLPWSMGSAEGAWFYGDIREIYIVVNNAANANDRNVSFTDPKYTPLEMRNLFGRCVWTDFEKSSWTSLASTKMKIMKRFKRKRTAFMEKQLEDGLTEDDIWDWDHAFAVDDWEVPMVRYVEARSMQQDWVHFDTF